MARNILRGAKRLIWTGLLLACMAGCDTKTAGEGAADASKQAAAADAAQADELRRYNAAVKALNQISSHALSSARSYANTFDAKRGPTGREDGPRVESIDHRWTQEALDELRKALAGRAPRDALDATSAKYVAAVERLVQLTAAAHRYYEQQDWRDDKFAKGRELHPQLVEAYSAFEAAYGALSSEVRRIDDAQRESRLAKLKASGQLLRHDLEVNLKQARDLTEFVETQLATAKRPQDMDLAALKERIDAFDGSFAELRKLGGKGTGTEHTQKEFGHTAYNFDEYLRQGDSFLLSAKALLRAGRDRGPMPVVHNPGESGVTGSYNQMVGAFNGLGRP